MGRDHTSDTLVVGNLTTEQTHRARLFVCGQSIDASEAHDLLDMLGLNGRPARSAPRQRAKPKRCARCHRLKEIKAFGLCSGCDYAVRRAS